MIELFGIRAKVIHFKYFGISLVGNIVPKYGDLVVGIKFIPKHIDLAHVPAFFIDPPVSMTLAARSIGNPLSFKYSRTSHPPYEVGVHQNFMALARHEASVAFNFPYRNPNFQE